MVIYYMLAASFFAYIAGACGQGMKQSWKKDLTVIFFLLASWYISVVMIGYVIRNP